MGVADLMQWAKKNHPQVAKSIRKRWADPQLAGKTVAIDGTLLTHAFTHSRRGVPEGLEEKVAILGWYNLITEMRASGVKPLAIWDKRGVREWKAEEARKRLASRALQLARKTHEDERAERLGTLREKIEEFEALAAEEKAVIRHEWETSDQLGMSGLFSEVLKEQAVVEKEEGGVKSKGKAKSQKVAEGKKVDTMSSKKVIPPPLPMPATPEVTPETMTRALTYLDSLSTVFDSFKRNYRPLTKGRLTISSDVEDAIEHVKELEELEQSISEPGSLAAQVDAIALNPVNSESEMTIIDEKLLEMIPPSGYTETPRQHALTKEEAQIITLLLSPSSIMPKEDGVEITINGEIQGADTAQQRMEELLEQAPEVREIYVRALAVPKTSDHEMCRELLVKMGVPVLLAIAPFEAEGLGASLVRAGLADFVGTEDSDVLALGSPMLRNLTSLSKPLNHISGSELQQSSTLKPSQFLDFCILLGTDANPRIPGVGPVNAFKLIQSHGTIEGILQNDKKVRGKLDDVGRYMEMVGRAREVFAMLPDVGEYVGESGAGLEQGVWRDGDVDRFLEERHGIMMMDEDAGGKIEEID